MQQIKFNYSLKKIGVPTQNHYLRSLIGKTDSFIQRMRWKAHFFLKANKENNNPKPVNTYRLKTKNRAPHVPELEQFEDNVARLLENVNFRDIKDDFIQALEKDKKRIEASKNVFVFADKTRNLYEMEASTYNKLVTKNHPKSQLGKVSN